MARKMATFLLVIIGLIALAIIGFSCSPAKKVLKENANTIELKQQFLAERQAIAAEAVANFVAANPCNQVPYINLDSLCSIYYKCPEYSSELTAQSSQPTAQTSPLKPTISHPKTILVPWQDDRAIKLLKDSINKKDERLAVFAALLNANKETTAAQVTQGVKNIKSWLWIFVVISIIEAVAIVVIAKK